jgi:hypothetical protein
MLTRTYNLTLSDSLVRLKAMISSTEYMLFVSNTNFLLGLSFSICLITSATQKAYPEYPLSPLAFYVKFP